MQSSPPQRWRRPPKASSRATTTAHAGHAQLAIRAARRRRRHNAPAHSASGSNAAWSSATPCHHITVVGAAA